jgi:transcriptional regulator with XRE-family HTH domain
MRAVIDSAGLRRAMALRGQTGAELARESGLTEATISHILSGRFASPTTIRKVARALTLCPTLPGAEGVIGSQEERDAAASPSPASVAEVSFASATAI